MKQAGDRLDLLHTVLSPERGYEKPCRLRMRRLFELSNYAYKMLLITATAPARTENGGLSRLPAFMTLTEVTTRLAVGWDVHHPVRYYSLTAATFGKKIDPFDTLPTSWTVYMPDGTVSRQSNGIQRIRILTGTRSRSGPSPLAELYQPFRTSDRSGDQVCARLFKQQRPHRTSAVPDRRWDLGLSR